MNKKLHIDGKEANVKYNLRTTEDIMDCLVRKSEQKQSVNVLINKILLSWKNKQK